jgi:hypothetical protein
MNGIRCAISLGFDKHGRPAYVRQGAPWHGTGIGTSRDGNPVRYFLARAFGSHSEAKREMRNYWLATYPDARIVDEVDL